MNGSRYLSSLLLAAAVAASFATSGCTVHTYRAYDPYYNDYHRWDHDEEVHYNQWVVETHHEGHPYKQLDRDDQKAYWQWRHGHMDHDRDRH